MGASASVSAPPKPAAPAASASPWLSAAGPATMLISSVGDAYSTSEAQKAQGEYAAGIYNVNARFAEVQAEDSIARGEFLSGEVSRRASKQVAAVRAKGKQIMGGQRASFAAQGIEGGSGSAGDVLTETDFLNVQDVNDINRSAAMDVITIKNNAWREAWGFKTEAQIYSSQGQMALSASKSAARNTILGGGLKALGYGLDAYSEYKKTGTATKATKSTGSKFYMPGVK